jgi:hypothetical protein
MQPFLILASIAGFAAKFSGFSASTDKSLQLQDIQLTASGKLFAVAKPGNASALSPGSLLSVNVVTGTMEEIQKAIESAAEENPYIKTLSVIALPAGAPKAKPAAKQAANAPAKEEAPAKQADRFVLILGTHQP